MREIARGLRPPALDEFGLRAALVALAEGFTERTGLRVRTPMEAELPRLDPDAELAVYRVAQEALTNAARHARLGGSSCRWRGWTMPCDLRVCDDGPASRPPR